MGLNILRQVSAFRGFYIYSYDFSLRIKSKKWQLLLTWESDKVQKNASDSIQVLKYVKIIREYSVLEAGSNLSLTSKRMWLVELK